MRYQEMSRWRLAALIILCLFSLNGYANRDDDDEDDDEMDEVTAEELAMENIPVDERIFRVRWNEVPFDKRFFTYTDEQIEEKWDYLMRGLRIPFPSAEYMRAQSTKYPFIIEGIKDFDGDFDKLEKRYLSVWRKFFAGDYQQARNEGLELGPIGLIPALFSQLMYAIYLTERQSEKYMMLQDVANRALEYFDEVTEIEDDPEIKTLAAAVRLGYAYAIARIAEESPIPIVVARGYIGKIKNNSDHITDLVPDHPLGHAFRAGVDAGIMRRVGKFTGRMTYNARSTVVGSSFGKARKLTPDIPIVAYEHGNALIYMNRNRNINEALALFEEASKMQPQFAMDALDTMYAHKRLQEVRLYTQNYRSFRKFEKDRRRFSRVTDRNLTNILSPVLTMDMLENPEKYKLAERR
jgi:tetratricopeptide (TPR) repeat protein